VKGEIIVTARENYYTTIDERYTNPDGLRRVRHISKAWESDFTNRQTVQYSDDNGATWGPEEDSYGDVYSTAPDGSWEIMNCNCAADVYNPAHRHFVGMGMQRIFKNGRKAAYEAFWRRSEREWSDHCFLFVRGENEPDAAASLIKFEQGPEFNPDNPLAPGYFNTNQAYFSVPWVMKNGDVCFAIGPLVSDCCRILGVDTQNVFPSNPGIFYGMIAGRGVWNGNNYDINFSRPVVLSDLLSSRGIDEPIVAELTSGRLLVAHRGSNTRSENWKTRIEPGAPGFKWYTYSDDGGKTFAPSAPWHFDDGEVIYSSATFSRFIRPLKNGKLYWVGNITGHKVDGNYPRWPLQIVEVDERYGTAKKNSLTVIDTRRDGEPDTVQLSNFDLMEDRATGDLEVRLTKIGQYGAKEPWRADTWKYTVTV